MNKLSKIEKMLVFCHFLADYHSGQWSRGYRYLSLTMKYFRSMGITHPLDISLESRHKKMYAHLVEKYQNEV